MSEEDKISNIKEFLYNWKRVCDYYSSGWCKGCPLSSESNSTKMGCMEYVFTYPDNAIIVINNWINNHPEKTLRDVFLEKFPNAIIEGFCPFDVWKKYRDERGRDCSYLGGCEKCWSRPAPKDLE